MSLPNGGREKSQASVAGIRAVIMGIDVYIYISPCLQILKGCTHEVARDLEHSAGARNFKVRIAE